MEYKEAVTFINYHFSKLIINFLNNVFARNQKKEESIKKKSNFA